MNLNKLFVLVMVAFVIGMLSRVHAGCDNEAPSWSIGACAENLAVCEGQMNFHSCEISLLPKHFVYENFPTKCVHHPGYNCNMPLALCHFKVRCRWVNGNFCARVVPSGWDYVDAKKRTAEKCNTPSPDPSLD